MSQEFCRNLNIEEAVSSSYDHQSNGGVEAHIKFIKTPDKCMDTTASIYLALLQVRSTPLEPRLPSPATLLFNCPISGIMPITNRLPINVDNDYNQYEVLIDRQIKVDGNHDTLRNYNSIPKWSTGSVSKRR